MELTLHNILLSIAAVGSLAAIPILVIWSARDYFRGRGGDRKSGGGGVSNFVGAGLQEIDRLLARPSVEHQIEIENQTQKREDDQGGE